MTIPSDPAEIANLKKIAELNKDAGDWQYSPLPRPDLVGSNSAPKDVPNRVGDKRLPLKKGR